MKKSVSSLFAVMLVACARTPTPEWARPDAVCASEGATGSIQGHVRDAFDGVPLRYASITLESDSTCSVRSDRAGRFTLAGVAPGVQQLRARLIGYRTPPTTVQVTPGGVTQVDIALQGPERFHHYTTRALPTDDRRGVLMAIVNFYRNPIRRSEADLIRESSRITGAESSAPVADIVIWARGSRQYRHDFGWLRKQRIEVCEAQRDEECPGTGLMTFLSIGRIHRVSPDTVYAEVSETALDPAACRRGPTFVGTNQAQPLVIRGPGGWSVARMVNTWGVASHGYCGGTPW